MTCGPATGLSRRPTFPNDRRGGLMGKQAVGEIENAAIVRSQIARAHRPTRAVGSASLYEIMAMSGTIADL